MQIYTIDTQGKCHFNNLLPFTYISYIKYLCILYIYKIQNSLSMYFALTAIKINCTEHLYGLILRMNFNKSTLPANTRFPIAGVQKIMVPGTSVKSSKEALRLTRLYPGTIYSTAGIHPHDSQTCIEDPSSWFDLETIAEAPECVAIGPCGLDYQRDFSEPEAQREIFEKQIRLAARLDKPLLIHERSAQQDVLDILKKYGKDVLRPELF